MEGENDFLCSTMESGSDSLVGHAVHSSVPSQPVTPPLYRRHFPDKFVFGSASSSYQYEGATEEGGRKASIWDTFCKIPGAIKDGSDGKEAVKFYSKYKDDVRIMKEMHLDAFRFSLSWPRILPDGKHGNVNQEGIDFYNGLINELISNNIEPFITLYHWDLPQALETKFKGFLDRQIVEEFEYFAEVCFDNFGDRVKYWITLNEPWSFCTGGYALGVSAPGRCSPLKFERKHQYSIEASMTNEILPPSLRLTEFYSITPLNLSGFLPPSLCVPTMVEADNFIPPATASRFSSTISQFIGKINRKIDESLNALWYDHGDSSREPYLVAHHQLLAHAAVVKLYRDKYQKAQGGKIGITNLSIWAVPYSEKECDKKAADRYNDFVFGWFMEPLISGEYPDSMKEYINGRDIEHKDYYEREDDRLPTFMPYEKEMLKGSFDFLGLNYYTARFAREATQKDIENSKLLTASYLTDHKVFISEKNCKGEVIGEQGCPEWLRIYPRGMKDMLLSVKTKYKLHDVPIYITENGIAEETDDYGCAAKADVQRKNYHYQHLCMVRNAIKEGMNVKGYFSWSLLDNFEWRSGYTVRFGLHHVNYNHPNKERRAKHSVDWFKILHCKCT